MQTKKLYFFLAFISLTVLEAKGQSFRTPVHGDGPQFDQCRLLQILEINAHINYQIYPLALLPIYSYPEMLVPVSECSHKNGMPLNKPLSPNFFSPILSSNSDPFKNKIELGSLKNFHNPSLYLFLFR
jgi:hypothetical protein